MSEHDPFDGKYDESAGNQPSQAAEQGTSPGESAGNQPLLGAPRGRPAESAPPASEVAHPETYTRTQLERMRKADLQVAARERGLSTLGDRDDLIDAIWTAQNA